MKRLLLWGFCLALLCSLNGNAHAQMWLQEAARIRFMNEALSQDCGGFLWETQYVGGPDNRGVLHYYGFDREGSEGITVSLTGDGYFGINESSPEIELQIRDSWIGDDNPEKDVTMRLQSRGSHNDAIIEFYETDAPAMSIHYEGNGNQLRIKSIIGGADDTLVTFDIDGNVGIGTSSPGQKLDIDQGHGRVDTGFDWLTNSDQRYKQNIATLEKPLEKLSRLRGVRFDRKDDLHITPGSGKHIGVIAQEIEKEYPELVATDQNSGHKAVAYDRLTAVLIEAVKELKLQNQKQQAEINALRTLVAAFKN